MSLRSFIYRFATLALAVSFSFSARANEGEHSPETDGLAPAEQRSNAPVNISSKVEGSSTTGQEAAGDPGPRSFLRNFVKDQKHIWTSPARVGRDLKWVLPVVVGTGVAIATDNRLSEDLPNPDDPARIAGKHVSQLGALYTVAGISAGTYLVGRFAANGRLQTTGWLGLEALAHTQIVVQGVKAATQRQRPPEPKPRRGFWTGGSSFPSGHAASTFAWATVVARQYSEKKIVPIGVYSLAAIVSAARLSARRHYASDILVGGAVGHLIGRYVHESRTTTRPGARAGLLTPRVGLRYSRPVRHYALNLSWGF